MAQKLDLETYTLQSGEKINDITEERFLDFLHSFESSLLAEKEYAESGEYEELEKRFKLLKENIDSLSENLANEPDPLRYLATHETKDIKEAMMTLDDYIRFVAANHWDNEEKKFEVFNTNYHSYDEWRNENVEEILDKEIENLEELNEKIARWDYDHDDGDQYWPQFTEAYYDKNEKLITLKIYQGYNDTWTSEKITIEEFLQEYKRAEKNNWITKTINEDFFSSLSKENQLLDKTNNSLEQSSLDKASELLKGIKFTPENYKKLLNVINDITEMSGTEQIQVPTEEQVQKVSEEKEPQAQTEIQDLDNEEKKQKVETFDPNAPIVYGKTVLPAFTVMSEGKLHSVENAVVMKFNKANQTYLIDNGSEKLELPTKTFETLLKDKQEQEEKIKVAEGRTIVFQDKERGIDGTVIPEFAMYTQHGLETFKDFVPVKHNPADDSYVISNGDTTMTVTAERFKEITAPERFENKFDENSPAWKKLCEQEYKDFFEPRDNTAYNFRHNLSVYCRKEANSPCDALHLAKDIISRMSKTEQKQTEKILKTMAHENESTNEVITRLYHEAIKEQPLNEDYIKKYQPENVIARPMYDTISTNGSKIENDPALIRGTQDRNLTIGTILKNINIETGSVFGDKKDSMHFDELKVISASKEGNSITVMDSNKSFIQLPRDTVLNMYKEQQIKEMKQEQRHYRTNSMNISYV